MVPNRVVLALGGKRTTPWHQTGTQARLFIQGSRVFTKELTPSCKLQQLQTYAAHASTSNDFLIQLVQTLLDGA